MCVHADVRNIVTTSVLGLFVTFTFPKDHRDSLIL